MMIGYLEPTMDAADGQEPWVAVRLFDRRPEQSLRARLDASRGLPAPAAQLLGVLTVELAEPNDDPTTSTDRVRSLQLTFSEPVDATDLHRFPWSRVIRAAITHQQARRSNTLEQWQQAGRAQAHLDASVVVAKRGPGRPQLPLASYVAIADRYRELVMEGVRNPTQTIAREAGVERATAASWVSRARKHGLLPAGKPGRVG